MVYSIVGIVAIIINIIINRDVLIRKKSAAESEAQKAYRLFNYGILAYHLTDVLWGAFDASGLRGLLYADTVAYFIAMHVTVTFWAAYVVKYLDDRGSFGKILLYIVNILLAIEIVAMGINHFYHIVFWIDESGEYHAYAVRYIVFAIQILLLLTTSVYAFVHQKKAEERTLKNRYKTISAFGIAMSIAIVLQIAYPLFPIYSIGYMIGICLIHIYVFEDENAELRRKADEANQAKTRFLFNMSHDIRTPMNAILGYTDIGISRADDPEAVRDSLDKIKLSGIHLLHLINDILEMSRIESGNLEIKENPTDVERAVNSLKKMSDSLATSRNIDFSVSLGNIADRYVYADELHINEVMINLISNAIKYTEEGGKVSVHIDQIGKAQNEKAIYRFEVADTGIGMSEEFQKHLFQPFAREKTATVSKTEGTGIGLSIVKRIVDMVNGNISVKTALGKGSVFTVEIPFKVMNEQEIREYLKEKISQKTAVNSAALKGKKVLLAEDNEMNREIAEFVLSDAGVVIDTAENGQIAVEMLKNKGIDYYDFVLMDIQMPVMDGYAATREIRCLQGSNRIPIIALSANAFEEDKAESLAAGMNNHVAKPINSTELFDIMAKYL